MEPPVAHLYVHVPFCASKCDYCAFVTHVGSLKLVPAYLEALVREAETARETRPGGPLQTVYFGGGTPSLLKPQEVEALLSRLDRLFSLASGCEVTLEAHPDTVDAVTLSDFRAAGVTRVSFGGESLDPDVLRRIGRRHTAERVLQVVRESRQAGFRTVNVDLMYGLPGQTLDSWRVSLHRILTVGPDHLSLYPLSIEPRTVFFRRWKQNMLHVPDDEIVVAMYHLACDVLRAAGYEHYEVANWAQPGHRCRHNLAYWHNHEFYAIGVGAHGYLKPYRTENTPRTRAYIDHVLGGGGAIHASHFVDERAEFSETVMLRLRLLQEGLELAEIQQRFGIDLTIRFGRDLAELTAGGLLRLRDGRLVLEESAVPIANEVWQRFML